ncbi:hypothetical protein FYK55_26680 [Roseiconus nitratireducens]|uniref:Lipoprotein n=1 Tax=Roseiconus nitratireducens TaxID=2605748 RepID=A0A5M6CXH7_9BACT|nr:hypothetical protein [Roseiconus nitratireducens]KAA5538702.1 hypothetical protein FYK55_26680 [Roseiconus nitratireducens]
MKFWILSGLLVALGCFLVPGCGDDQNRVVEQPDAAQLKAKQEEFAAFQKRMSQQSKLPGAR